MSVLASDIIFVCEVYICNRIWNPQYCEITAPEGKTYKPKYWSQKIYLHLHVCMFSQVWKFKKIKRYNFVLKINAEPFLLDVCEFSSMV